MTVEKIPAHRVSSELCNPINRDGKLPLRNPIDLPDVMIAISLTNPFRHQNTFTV